MRHGILRTSDGAAGEAEMRMNLAQELLQARAQQACSPLAIVAETRDNLVLRNRSGILAWVGGRSRCPRHLSG